jgi:hypothetical protein
MATKIAFGPLGDAFAALRMILAFDPALMECEGHYPGYENVFRQASVRVLDLDEGELNAAVVEFVYQVLQLALCSTISLEAQLCGWQLRDLYLTYRQCSAPSTHSPFRHPAEMH